MKFYKLLFIALIPGLTACGTLDSIFPDRKKEYKDTKTIPPLEIPPDLSTSSIEDALPLPNEQSSFKIYAPSGDTESVERKSEVAPKLEVPFSTLVTESQGNPYIRLSEEFPSAWRTTGKALANLAIEIEDRNRSVGTYYILYAEKAAVESEGFFASMAFWRDEVVVKELSYQVKVKQDDSSTIIEIHDEQDQLLSQGVGLILLKELHAQFLLF
ncbi:MAG: hypothetical protein DRQ61_06275 [Gammaproteobacteria bacterium]|nr:MAG: hypothetical protein DRQ56_08665 [Gammaproteobacteria bacterium]RLA22461.1 MAG: hypothetical protein DRQ61_06275 [Gammaproteobacteria bacterium]